MVRFILFFVLFTFSPIFSYSAIVDDLSKKTQNIVKQAARYVLFWHQMPEEFRTIFQGSDTKVKALESFGFILKESLRSKEKKPLKLSAVLSEIKRSSTLLSRCEGTIDDRFKLKKENIPNLASSTKILWDALDLDYKKAISSALEQKSVDPDDLSSLNAPLFFYYLIAEMHKQLGYTTELTVFGLISRLFVQERPPFTLLGTLATAAHDAMTHRHGDDLASLGSSTVPSSRRESDVGSDAGSFASKDPLAGAGAGAGAGMDVVGAAQNPPSLSSKKTIDTEEVVSSPPPSRSWVAGSVAVGVVGITLFILSKPDAAKAFVGKLRGWFRG